MTEEMFRQVLETAEAKRDKDGNAALPEGKSLTLYAAHDGVPLTVAKIESVWIGGGVVKAQNGKGDLFLFSITDLFAAAIEGGAARPSGRKAGFLG
jgi:hypothetical protein